MSRDMEYFRRRAAEERIAAMQAAHPKVREAHLEMARMYEDRMTEPREEGQVATLDLPTVA